MKALSKPTRLEQQKTIRPAERAAKDELEQKTQRFAMLSTQPMAARYAEPGYWNKAFEEDEDGSLA